MKYILLYPLSLIYGLVTGIRNFLFNKGILKSVEFDMPVICVGNLTAGGTGKTPHTEFILSLLQDKFKTAVLSRGYKRKTKGFRLADDGADAYTIGDEPYQIHLKFPKVQTAVDEKRVRGVNSLMELVPGLELIVLDDAFQHRRIKPGLSVLLTDYSRLYINDCLLPAGRLREWKKGSRRADIIVVAKCPASITPDEMMLIQSAIRPGANQSLFFSTYQYDDLKPVFPGSAGYSPFAEGIKQDTAVLVMAGIVSPQPVVDYLKGHARRVDTLLFPDHHPFTAKDLDLLSEKFNSMMNFDSKIIVVTEKDAARLLSNKAYPEELKSKTFALPIQVKILNNEKLFIEKIEGYVKENSRNSRFS